MLGQVLCEDPDGGGEASQKKGDVGGPEGGGEVEEGGAGDA